MPTDEAACSIVERPLGEAARGWLLRVLSDPKARNRYPRRSRPALSAGWYEVLPAMTRLLVSRVASLAADESDGDAVVPDRERVGARGRGVRSNCAGGKAKTAATRQSRELCVAVALLVGAELGEALVGVVGRCCQHRRQCTPSVVSFDDG
jgi:hypothetical protein